MKMLQHMERLYKNRTSILILFYLYFINCQPHVENVALTGKCNMTERFANTGNCTKAIDNVTNLTLGFTDNGPENCIHTLDNTRKACLPFWQVILNEEYTITNITIYNREGNQRRLTYTNVTVNGTLCKSFGSDVSTIQNVNTFNCSSPIRGSTVTISRHYSTCTNDSDYTLNLCEVQVWVCIKGWYGKDCNTPCSGHCSNNLTCDRYDGSCPQVCIKGWYGKDCNTPCSGHCSNNVTCDRYDGSCPQGCISGWHGSRCDNSCPQNCIGACNQSSGVCFALKEEIPAGIIVGVCVGALMVIIAVVLFIFICRQQRTAERETSNSPLHSQNIPTENIATGVDLIGHVAKAGDSNQSKKQKSQRPMTTVGPRENTVSQKGPTNQMYENVSAANKTAKRGDVTSALTAMQEDLQSPVDFFDDDVDDIYNTEDIYSTYKPLVVWDAFQQSILSSLASGQLSVHFKGLPKGLINPHSEGIKPENMRKNRFKTILPYDANRVILQRSKAEKDSDYINASYVKGYMKENAYIATQGPRAHMVNDFWLMIWQRNSAQIIMLTNVKENGKDKCVEYWPVSGTSRTYGNTMVTCLSEDRRADFIARKFTLKQKGSALERQVQHCHYVAWPDHGVPSATSLVDFWRYVRAHALPSSLPVVHCSAGVGRTGTYIALDIAMDLVANGSDVNVLKIVMELREDRIDMVQAEAQFKFLYEAVFEAYTSRNCRLTRAEFDEKFPQPINITKSNVVIDNECKILQLMGEFMPKSECVISSRKENIIKCRNASALPDDNHLVYLKGHNQSNTYINIVRMPSFKRHNGVLLTQLPLPDTLFDFWRLVDESDVTTIVSLSHKDESKIVKNYCQYWPKSSKEELTVDQYDIKMVASTVLGHHLTSYNVTIQKVEDIRTVQILHFTNWVDEVPGDPNDIIQLLETLNTYRFQRETNPVLVQCIDGVVKSGLFCVMSEIFDRMTYDHVIDVFLSARHVQAVRPQAITKEPQYRFCYKFAQAVKRHQGVYENTSMKTSQK